LDGTAIPANLGGVGRYIDDLAPELVNAGVNLSIAVKERDAAHFSERLSRARVIPVSGALDARPVRMLWEQTGLPALVRKLRPDVLHSPHYTSPARAGCPVAITLHDATFFSHPEAHSPLKRVFFQTAIRRAVKVADAVIVPSVATRDETIRYAGGDARHFVVAYHGVDRTVFHPVDDAERNRVAASLGLSGRRRIGFLGTLEPRKNVPNLVRGWTAAVQGMADPPALVLAGGRGWDAGVEPALEDVPEGLTVVRPGYLPLQDLPGFLSGCEVLAYPSIAEGFGLPVLEAMSCGAATLTTRLTSLPEVGGDAVAYCEPSAESIATELRALLDDPARRIRLSQAAVARAEKFTWAASAKAHLEAYRAAIRNTR
jgi:glycosyltransferase involved in cell wall biosynthesis